MTSERTHVLVCDRCGSRHDLLSGDNPSNWYRLMATCPPFASPLEASEQGIIDRHLCPDCRQALSRWFQSPEPSDDSAWILPDAVAVIEEIMTQHWDMVSCSCWVCSQGRTLGLGAREQYLPHHRTTPSKPRVLVEFCLCRNIKYPTNIVHTESCPHYGNT